MTLPVTGSLSFAQVNAEIRNAAGSAVAMNDTAVRKLFGKASGAISMEDGKGKTLEVPVDYLLVGGGGGGRYAGGGGGGAGGMLASTTSLPVVGYTITIGAGGASNANGGNTAAFGLTAFGGGTGGDPGGV